MRWPDDERYLENADSVQGILHKPWTMRELHRARRREESPMLLLTTLILKLGSALIITLISDFPRGEPHAEIIN